MKEATLIVSLDSIRFDKRISPMGRIFYAEICGNVTVESGCPVNDEYFAKLYGVSARQVRTWRTELKKFGYTKESCDSLGFKYILPIKFDYEEQLNSLKIKKAVDVTYIAPDGRKITNTEDAYKYFHPLINSSGLPQSFLANTMKFFNTFINVLFDLDYYNKKFTNSRFETTREFYQYVIDVIKPVDIYRNADAIFTDNFSGIKNLTYYTVATIVNLYKDEFMSKQRRKHLAARRTSEKEAEIQRERLKETEIKTSLCDEQQRFIKNKIEKEIQTNKELNEMEKT